jgi:hypothetical protein
MTMKIIDLMEALSVLTFQSENTDSYSNQSNVTLRAFNGKTQVGYIDYVIYQGRPSISMIEVSKRRSGVATAMLQDLQRKFPGIEIEWGMQTADGAALYKSIPKTIIPNKEIQAKMARLEQCRADEKKLQELYAKWEQIEHPTEKQRVKFLKMTSHWNDLNDEIYDLERELHGEKPETVLIRT